MLNKIPRFSLIILFFNNLINASKTEINLIGFIKYSQGIGQVSLGFIHCLHKDVKINLFSTQKNSFDGIPEYAKKIINSENQVKTKTNKFKNNITIYTDLLLDSCFNNFLFFQKKITDNNTIKFIYSMVESTKVPSDWVHKINKHFDAVIVPDKFLIEVYKNSGVKIPIFLLPICLNYYDCLNLPTKEKSNNPFTFGYCAGFGESKNYKLLIDAFCQEFKNNKNVILRLHGNDGYYCQIIKNYIKDLKVKNIILTTNELDRENYVKFISSFDCYVTFSKGEGFSITPREAMAAGIPCIISNNTAHKTICQSNFVYSLDSNIIEPHVTGFQKIIGFDFNCKLEDSKKALKEVYNNYNYYLKLSKMAKEWSKQYLPTHLKDKYLRLIKPQKIIFGAKNEITNRYIMTNSLKLYIKYKKQIHKKS